MRVLCRFVAANAWNIAEVGLGVTGLVVAGLAVGRYVSVLLAKLAVPVYIRHDTTVPLPVINIRTTSSPTTASLDPHVSPIF